MASQEGTLSLEDLLRLPVSAHQALFTFAAGPLANPLSVSFAAADGFVDENVAIAYL